MSVPPLCAGVINYVCCLITLVREKKGNLLGFLYVFRELNGSNEGNFTDHVFTHVVVSLLGIKNSRLC